LTELHPDMSVDEQLDVLTTNTEEVLSEDELKKKLQKSKEENKPLKIKLGLDPSAPDIHLGHTVVLKKMREFQELGHEVICLIGDFTGRVGDPSGVSETRNQLSEKQVTENAKTYEEQVMKVLDADKTTIDFNSRWLKGMTFADLIELASHVTVSRMIERNDFAERLHKDQPVYVHEFFYPLMQGYDSVALKADVELGGTDQKFNLMMARDIQRAYEVEPEVAMLMPVMEGTDGTRKMSKSLDNYIGVNEDADSMFGKVMSISDDMIVPYFKYMTWEPESKIEQMAEKMKEGKLNPRNAKVQLAETFVRMYHDDNAAEKARNNFETVFSRGGQPEDIEEVRIGDRLEEDGEMWIVELVRACDFASSNSEARRLIKQGAVSIDGEKITDPTANVCLMERNGSIFRVGKRRFARLIVE